MEKLTRILSLNVLPIKLFTKESLHSKPHFLIPMRNYFVVKRKFPAPLRKSHKFPSLRRKHRIYETVQDTEDYAQPRKMNVILTTYVNEIGKKGELVTLEEPKARFLLLTKSALYASPENIKRLGDSLSESTEDSFSSRFVGTTLKKLEALIVSVTMNKDCPWVVDKYHIQNAFRKAGVQLSLDCIALPDKKISGPDPKLEGKEFFVKITVNGNKTESTPVRCRIHHWVTNPKARVEPSPDYLQYPAELIFPEDEEISKSLPAVIAPKKNIDPVSVGRQISDPSKYPYVPPYYKKWLDSSAST